jgi:glycosyltransferase involved in cell wall biosynthesis
MGISPTLAGASVAVAAARRSGVPCLLWFQDLMGQAAEQSGIKGGDRVAGAVRKTEHILARQADSVVVCSEGYRGYFENAGVSPHNVHVVRNWSLLPPGTVSKRTARAQFDFRADQTVVVHSGNMGAKQGLEVVLEAAAGAPDVLFVLQGNGSERVSLEAAVDARNLTNVEFLPSLSPEDLVNLLRAADVLLLTQRASVTDMSLPSKLTAYIPAHTPIVASVSADSEAAALLDEAATGRVVEPGNAEVLVHAIRVAAVDPVSTTGDEARLFGSPAHFESLLEDLIR